ncbi:hypothetical protein RvY_02521 [Ramazzottius varieornatus]|uniref:Uncharacterized protein n=1 Tax=Ramazzottius varieornatus TaxID=947166 RepID=A0A1D1UNR7_RAMVA|nr:hypothetical protein RvY_02521 [Ramazzottius varieornatus]
MCDILCWGLLVVLPIHLDGATAGEPSDGQRSIRAASFSLQNQIGFAPRDILIESLDSKTCFDMKNRGQTVGTHVVLGMCTFPSPQWNQLFMLQDVDGQHFTLSNQYSSCFTFQPGTQLLASASQCSGDTSKFFLDNSADGQSYLIRQKGTAKCVVPFGGGGTSGGTEVLKAAPCDKNDPAQFWRIFSKDKPRRFAPHPSRCMN